MNKIYTTVWNESRQQWVVTSELATGPSRPKLTPRISALALLLGAVLLPSGPVMAADYIGVTVDGSTGNQNLFSGDTATSTTIKSGGQQHISIGGSATVTTISSGGQQHVYSGGTATETAISSGGWQYVSSGGSATSTTIHNGGNQSVISGGAATSTTIFNKGTQHISSGGVASSTIISRSGDQYIYTDAKAIGTNISGGHTIDYLARQHISSGGVATNTTINNGGVQYIYAGGMATSTTIFGGGSLDGTQHVYSGGTANSTTINSGGRQYVSSGGIVTSTTIEGGYQYISNEGSATSTNINNGGRQFVSSGGIVTSTTIEVGYQSVSSGGTAILTRLGSGGSQYVSNGGSVTSTTINSGGKQYVYSGGSVSYTIIHSGGQQYVSNGGSATSTTINNSASQYVSNGGTATSTTINSGGQQFVNSGGTATFITLDGGYLGVTSGATVRSVTISNSAGYLSVGKGATITDTTIESGRLVLSKSAVADGKTQINAHGQLSMPGNSLARDVNVAGGEISIYDYESDPIQIDKLTMDSGNVSFWRYYAGGGNNNPNFSKLNISELSGSGNFLFNTSLAERNSNFVTIEQGSGHFGIAVTDSGKEISDHTDLTVNLIHEQGGDINFEMVTASGRSIRAVDGGTYMYTLFSQQDKDGLNGGNVWYLGAMTDEPGGGENPGGGDNGNAGGNGNGGKKPMTTPATDAILAMSNAGLNVIHSELDGLRTYRASLDKTGPESNVWGHYLGSKNDIDTSNGAAYTLNQNGMEIGADTRTDFDRGSLITGAFMSYSDNKVKHARGGTSKIDSYGLGLYATWFDASRFYVDGVVKGNRLNNKLSAVMTNGGKTSGDWKKYALSTAVEGGYQFDLKDDVSITPYGRLAFVQMTSEEVKLSNGMKGNTGTPRSVTGESGAKLSGKFSLGSTEFKPYLSAAVVQEFANSNEVTINERNRFDNNVKGT